MNAALAKAAVRRGYTLVETVVALTIFSVIGYVLLLAVRIGADSQQEIIRVASESQSLRDATRAFVEELRQTTNSQVTVDELADGNSELTFRQAIEVDGDFVWGVFDTSLGTDVDAQTRQDWSVRYTVEVDVVDGVTTRNLVRQLLDDGGKVQREKIVVSGLCSGKDATPGFLVEDGGAVWVITLSVERGAGKGSAKSMVVHVNTIN